MKCFAYKSRYKENNFSIYVIENDDPRNNSDWIHESYERVFIGAFETFKEAVANIQNIELNFSEWEELDDSALQGETVYVRR